MSVQRENERYLPFLLTTTFMMEAVRRGVGRETAHEAIKEHATATMRDLRSGTTSHNDLLDRLAADARLGLSRADLDAAFARGQEATGAADSQVATTVAAMRTAAASCPDAARYQPGEIL
jgi:adenylosuccinate lyase